MFLSRRHAICQNDGIQIERSERLCRNQHWLVLDFALRKRGGSWRQTDWFSVIVSVWVFLGVEGKKLRVLHDWL